MSVADVNADAERRFSRRAAWAEGQPISDLMARALANPELISLAAGFVDQRTLPVEPTAAALKTLFADETEARAALQYGTTPGFPKLRRQLLERTREADQLPAGDKLGVDRFVVTAGSNQLLHLVAESLCDPGDIVLCAAPTYLVFLGTLANVGARSIGVATDDQGMLPDALEETLERLQAHDLLSRVRAIYLVSYYDNPAGATMSLDRKAKIVEAAERWSSEGKIYVIEDAAYRELRYAGDDVPTALRVDEDHDTVVLAGTFSKSYSPGVRVGWGVLPAELVEPVCNQKGNIDFGSPNFSQHLMAQVLEQGSFEPHVEKLRAGYSEKLRAMVEAADEFLAPLEGVSWREPTGGLYVWLRMPSDVDTSPEGELFDAAIEEGVLYVPGRFCYPAEGAPVDTQTMRLSFGVQSPERIRDGMEALARAVKRVRR